MSLFGNILKNDELREDSGQGRTLPEPGWYLFESYPEDLDNPDSWKHPKGEFYPSEVENGELPTGYTLSVPLRIIGGPSDLASQAGKPVFAKLYFRAYAPKGKPQEKKPGGVYLSFTNALISPGVAIDLPKTDPARHLLRNSTTEDRLSTFAEREGITLDPYFPEPDQAHALVHITGLYLKQNPGKVLAELYHTKPGKNEHTGKEIPSRAALSNFTDPTDPEAIQKHKIVYYVLDGDELAPF